VPESSMSVCVNTFFMFKRVDYSYIEGVLELASKFYLIFEQQKTNSGTE
jgi:hypothetical protein